jgi:hypothetical protein
MLQRASRELCANTDCELPQQWPNLLAAIGCTDSHEPPPFSLGSEAIEGDRRYVECKHHSFHHHYHLACYEKRVRADEREAWPTPLADVHQVLRSVPSQDGGRYLLCHQTAFPPIAAMRPERQS